MTTTDDFFGPAYVDVDEWRDEPVRHRYLHGGFEGTDTRFSLYMLEKEKYEGRFLHLLEGSSAGNETTAHYTLNSIALAADCGAYLVESNQGHLGDLQGAKGDQTIIAFRASAQTARFAKTVAAEMYGEEPSYGYVYGSSGGARRTLNCLENVDDLWDGGVALKLPSELTSTFMSLVLNAARVLRPVLPQIYDAIEVGGSGNPFAGLTSAQAEALALLYKVGFPRGTILEGPGDGLQIAVMLAQGLPLADAEYLKDFWTKPGYLGADDPQSLADDLVELETTVTALMSTADLSSYRPEVERLDRFGMGDAARVSFRPGVLREGVDPTKVYGGGFSIADGDPGMMGCANVTVLTGEAAGRELNIVGVVGDFLVVRPPELGVAMTLAGIESGDRIRISNRDYLAACLVHRHQIEADSPDWSSLVVDGNPIYPQRDRLEGLLRVHMLPHTHELGGKKAVIVQNAKDGVAWPNAAVRYEEELRDRLGSELEDSFRLYFVEHAQHVAAAALAPTFPEVHAQYVDFDGFPQQAVKDLIAWVEYGEAPLPGDTYVYEDGALKLAESAHDRRGLQPVVAARANGSPRADVRVGETVTLDAEIETPPGAGRITRIEWDPEGSGEFTLVDPGVDGTAARLTSTVAHAYGAPGTYFPAVRVSAHRDGETEAALYQVRNLGRSRVVVSAGAGA
jgi:hypothetical protein